MLNVSNLSLALFYLMITLISLARSEFLIIVETLLVITILMIAQPKNIFPILVGAIYLNYYAPMDNELRFSSQFPSLHTFNVSAFKLIDLVLLAAAARILLIGKIIFSKSLSILIFSFSLIILVSTAINLLVLTPTRISLLLYVARTSLIFILTYISLQYCTEKSIRSTLKLCCASIIILMCLSFVFPPDNALTREIFGLKFLVVIAGDEYMAVGMIALLLLLLREKKSQVILFMVAALICGVLAGRKAALLFFFFALLAVWVHTNRPKILSSFILLTQHFYILMMLPLLAISRSDPAIAFAFSESFGILESTLASISKIATSHSLYFGLSPAGLYETINLDASFDHAFSFGNEAQETYRYKIWFLPFDRLVINFGLMGVILTITFLIRNLVARTPLQNYFLNYSILLISGSLISFPLACTLGIFFYIYLKESDQPMPKRII